MSTATLAPVTPDILNLPDEDRLADFGSLTRGLRFFDLEVTPRTAVEVADIVDDAVTAGQGLIIGNVNLHGLYMYETDPTFKRFTDNADLCLVDGWPVLKLINGSKLSGGYRIGSTDWLDVLLERGNRKFAAIAGTPESSAATQKVMREKYHVDWVGIPGFDLDDNRAAIRDAVDGAEVVLVGLGMPKQEAWILNNLDLLQGKVVANVGGCIDYYNGSQDLAPRWMGAFGLEWVYRLAKDPKRMAYRYLIEPLKLLVLVVKSKLGGLHGSACSVL